MTIKLPSADELKAADAFLVWIADNAAALQGVRDGTHRIVPIVPKTEPMKWDGIGEIFDHNCKCEKCCMARQAQRDRDAVRGGE